MVLRCVFIGTKIPVYSSRMNSIIRRGESRAACCTAAEPRAGEAHGCPRQVTRNDWRGSGNSGVSIIATCAFATTPGHQQRQRLIVLPPRASVPDCDWNMFGVERFGSWWYVGATISSSRLITEAQRDVKLAQDRDGLELGMAISKYVLVSRERGRAMSLGTHLKSWQMLRY
jgi:hypothetical protein